MHHLNVPLHQSGVDNLACLSLENHVEWDVAHHNTPEREPHRKGVKAFRFDPLVQVIRAIMTLNEVRLKDGKNSTKEHHLNHLSQEDPIHINLRVRSLVLVFTLI